ncbi:hypothetical protein [Pedococcus sp. 2YAF34]|uniref:hypothetical protein n=1 Tax=Pedococcus sp. 2YAF34 TaxID=3233032 RepID=UPI003F99C56C
MPSATARPALAAALLTTGLLGVGWGAAASPAGAAGGDFQLLDARVAESSGLALSRRHPHTVWTTNDSGDSARLFAVDTRTGRTTGVHQYGAPVRDVEALAITPQGRVLVGDLGDNTTSRSVVRVFWFDEPDLGDTAGGWASWELEYPDGPHDAESLAVDPRSGRVYVVTKGASGAVYALPRVPSRRGVNRLTRVATAPAVATDAVYLADGSALLVRTYTQVVRLDATAFDEVGSAFLPLQRQGETIALAPGGSRLLVGSEGVRSTVRVVDVPSAPAAPTTRATAAPTTPATAAPTTPATGSPTTPTAASATTAPSTSARPGSPPVSARQVVWGASASVGLVAFALLSTWLARRAAGGHR